MSQFSQVLSPLDQHDQLPGCRLVGQQCQVLGDTGERGQRAKVTAEHAGTNTYAQVPQEDENRRLFSL